MVSFDRIQQLFLEVFGLKISQTTLSKFNKIGSSLNQLGRT
ncbi:MAG: hypothetical protein Q9M97_08705 [Candidatus Gracilibacteria bacterium]|nr:hypothetical protein [Candidatus Gracilibacteria bacterium]